MTGLLASITESSVPKNWAHQLALIGVNFHIRSLIYKYALGSSAPISRRRDGRCSGEWRAAPRQTVPLRFIGTAEERRRLSDLPGIPRRLRIGGRPQRVESLNHSGRRELRWKCRTTEPGQRQ